VAREAVKIKISMNGVETHSWNHFTGSYKDLRTVPTKALRLIFYLLKIQYHRK